MTGFTIDAAAALPGPAWLRERRTAAAERFAAEPLPTDAEEVWRYSRIGELDLGAFHVLTGDVMPTEVAPAVDPAVAATGDRGALVVVRNGRVVRADVDDSLRAQGITVGGIDAARDGDAIGSVASAATDAFTDLNAAFALDAAVVRVPAGVVVDQPVVVLHVVDADGAAVFPATLIAAGADSEVVVIEHQTSPGHVRAFVDPVVELDVGPAARVRYVNVQRFGDRIWQTGYQASRVAKDATLQSTVVALGGDYARVRMDSRLEGRGATSELRAVYFGAGTQMHDFRTMQDHAAPSTTSDLLFKGAVKDQSRSVYSGLIRVRKEAQGTNAFQTNRNLVLTEGAHADSVPNLEIEANDVKCSHASAVGPIDEEQRYYLESRGVPPAAAERLIVLGFFADVLERLPLPGMVRPLRDEIAEKLAEPA